MHSFSFMFICIHFFTYIMSFLLHSFLHLLRVFYSHLHISSFPHLLMSSVITLMCLYPHFLTSSCPFITLMCLCPHFLTSSCPFHYSHELMSSFPHLLMSFFRTLMCELVCTHFLTSSCPHLSLLLCPYVHISSRPHVLFHKTIMPSCLYVLHFFN